MSHPNPSQQFDPEHHQLWGSVQSRYLQLTETNENILYNIGILESELAGLKAKQAQKIKEGNKIKDKIKSKSDKEQDLKRHAIVQRQKIKRMVAGYRNLSKQLEQATQRQENKRETRLEAQEKKNTIYQSYHELQNEYKQLLEQLSEFKDLPKLLNQSESTNKKLIQEIEEIEQCLQQEEPALKETTNVKKSRTIKIKDMNNYILQLEDEEKKLKDEIAMIEKNREIWENERDLIESKSSQANLMYSKVQQSKATLAAKKLEFSEIDSLYRQLCIQENKMRKEFILEKQCREEQRKYRLAKSHSRNNPIPSERQSENLQSHLGARTSKVAEVGSQSPGKQLQDSSMVKLQSIMERFERIKSKGHS